MGIKITNNAASLLTTALTAIDTSCSVTVGTGALYPTLGVGDYFFATIQDASNRLEIIKVTARATDGMTIVRAQEGTTALTWSAGDILELRMTAQTFTDLAVAEAAAALGTKVSKTSDTGSAILPVGTSAQRDGSPQAGYIRYNTTIPSFEGYTGTEWGAIGGGGSGATGGGSGNLQDLVFVENDALVTNDYIIGQGNQKSGATFTNGSANIGFTGHGFVAEQLVMFSTTGTLPTNFTAWVGYYVIPTGLTADVFQVSATVGGSAISAGSAGTGTHSVGKLKHASTVSLNVLTGKTVTIPTNVTLVVN